MVGDPRVQVRQGDRLALLRIGDQVDELRGGERPCRIRQVPLFYEHQLEIPPLCAVHLAPHPVDVPLASGCPRLSGESLELIDAVDDAIVRLRQIHDPAAS
jgi:hypothetical protein